MMTDSIVTEKPHPKVELTPRITKGHLLSLPTQKLPLAPTNQNTVLYTNKGTTEKSEKKRRKGKELRSDQPNVRNRIQDGGASGQRARQNHELPREQMSEIIIHREREREERRGGLRDRQTEKYRQGQSKGRVEMSKNQK